MWDDNYDELLIVGVSIAVMAISWMWYRRLSLFGVASSEENTELVELTPLEKGGLMKARSITTITFYEGDFTTNSQFKGQILKIMQANPWLGGRLVKTILPGKKGKEVALKYSKTFDTTTFPGYFQELYFSEDTINEKSTANDIIRVIGSRFCESGKSCTNKDELLFKVTVVKIFNEKKAHPGSEPKVIKSGLLYSLSHVIADGFTFYRLYQMFDGKQPVEPLIVQRDIHHMERINIKRTPIYQQLPSISIILVTVFRMIFCSSRPKCKIFKIQAEELNKLKENCGEELQTISQKIVQSSSSSTEPAITKERVVVSTNDVITSWFLRKTKVSFGFLTINFRIRFPELTKDHAGNYEGFIVFSPKDYNDPLMIRKALLNNYSAPNTCMPQTYQELFNFHPALVTNWSSFYSHLEFTDAKHLHHMPVLTMDRGFNNYCVIFRPDQGHLSIAVATDNKTMLANIKEDFLGEE
jgi:hypothetical protein